MSKVTILNGVYAKKMVVNTTFDLVNGVSKGTKGYFITVDGSTACGFDSSVKFAQRNIRIKLNKPSDAIEANPAQVGLKPNKAPTVIATTTELVDSIVPTNKLTKIGKTNAVLLGAEMQEALQAVAKKYGVSIKKQRGSYTDAIFSTKFEVALISDSGEVETREALNFKLFSKLDNISEDALNKTFGRWIFRGYNTKAHKMPYEVEDKNTGKLYKLTASQAVFAYTS